MNPDQFQAFVIAWLGVITLLIPAVFALARLLLLEWLALHKTLSGVQAKTESLDRQVNGAMTIRIDEGAKAAIAADKEQR